MKVSIRSGRRAGSAVPFTKTKPGTIRRLLAPGAAAAVAGTLVLGLVGLPAANAMTIQRGAIGGLAGKCVDDNGANPTNGTQIQLWTCNGTGAQSWTVGSDGTIRALGKCMDVTGGSTVRGTRIQLWDCNGTGAQRWVANGSHELVNPQSGLCLDATGASSADGTPLEIWTCNGNANQRWDLPGVYGTDVFFEQSGTHHLWMVGPNDVGHDLQVGVSPDSSPASTWTSGGSVVVFKRDSDGLLWQIGPGGGQPQLVASGLGVAANTSPSIATANNFQNVVIAFQAAGSGDLWWVDEGGAAHDTGIKMAAGTSPAITELSTGAVWIVFKRDSDGLLWRLDPGHDLRFAANGLGVAAGTSPAIAPSLTGAGDGFAIAFQAAGAGDLWWVDENNAGHDTGIKMVAGTSPGIAGLDNGSFEMVFRNDSDGLVYRLLPGIDLRYIGAGYGEAPGTSPAIAAIENGFSDFMIAFQASDLWTVDADNVGHDTGLSVQPGTSPSINRDCSLCIALR
jgi:hypothetical protein